MIELYSWTIEAKPGAQLVTELVADEVRCRSVDSIDGEAALLAERLKQRGGLALAFVVVRDGDELTPIRVDLDATEADDA